MKWAYYRRGFTIVELLIVVVVIAILAAITIVAYNGITQRTKDATAQSAAAQATKKLALYAVDNTDLYPPDEASFLAYANLQDSGTGTSSAPGYQYTTSSDRRTFCLTTTMNSLSYFTTNAAQTPKKGACPGHGVNGGAVVTNVLLNPSAEVDLTNINPYGGVPERDTSTADGGGVASVRADVTQPSRGIIFMGASGALASSPYWCSVALSGTAGLSVTVSGRHLTASEGYINEGSGAQAVTLSSSWQRVTITFTSTNNANLGIVALQIVSNTGTTSGSIRADRAICSPGSTPSGYGDGATTGWAWSGTANNSSSSGPAQ